MFEQNRRNERERVLSLLYEAEMKSISIDDVLAELPVQPDEFVVSAVRGVSSTAAELDQLVQRHAIDWKVERMAVVDRAILRFGAWELKYQPELPLAVAISEAVELAKRFSTEESGSFVNGILAAIAAQVRP